MSGKNTNKDKEMSANLKSDGVARGVTRCPLCHKVLGGHRRATPESPTKSSKGYTSYDFGGALFAHFANCGKG